MSIVPFTVDIAQNMKKNMTSLPLRVIWHLRALFVGQVTYVVSGTQPHIFLRSPVVTPNMFSFMFLDSPQYLREYFRQIIKKMKSSDEFRKISRTFGVISTKFVLQKLGATLSKFDFSFYSLNFINQQRDFYIFHKSDPMTFWK